MTIQDRDTAKEIKGQLQSKQFEIKGEREIIPSLEDVFISIVNEVKGASQKVKG